MGNCCGNPNTHSLEVPAGGLRKTDKPIELIIYGDFTQVESRILYSALDFCQVNFVYENIETKNGEHMDENYLSINPLGQVPTIKHGMNSVIGGYTVYLTCLARAFPQVKKTLYPQ